MSIPLNINGTDYDYPEQGDVSWGPDATDWAVAVTNGMLQKAGGTFQLLAEVDFGTAYGLKSLYYKSRTSNPASAGQIRLARTDVVSFRNQANSANLDLGVNSSDQLTFNGSLVLNSIGTIDSESKSANGAVIGSTGLVLQTADASYPGLISTSSQTMAGHKQFTDGVTAGDPGTEGSGIDISGVTFNSTFKVSDIDGTNYAQTILHRHSTALEPLIVGARSNSDTSAHSNVTGGQGLFTVYAAGYAGSNYKLFGSITLAASSSGSISNTSAPGKIVLSVTANGATSPSPALTIEQDKSATFAGQVSIGSLSGVVKASAGVLSASSIVNADISSSAAIALSKLAALTASRALTSDASGVITASSVTSTELGYVSGVTSAIQTQLDAKVAKSGDTMTGLLVLSGDPVANLGAATKQYVDNAIQGLKAKQAVVCATTANITLSGEQTIDGVLTSGSRVLVKNQSSSAENGIYVSAAGAWSRASDANTWDELVSAYVFVSEGTTQADTGWLCTINAGGTLGSTPVTFVQFSSAGVILAGVALTKTGNTLDVNYDNSTIDVSGNNLRVKPLGIADAQISTTAAIAQSKLALNITNTQINASAAIARTKLASGTAYRILVNNASGVMSENAAITASRAVASDANGQLVAVATTATELGYVNGVTSAIQTQLNTKMANPMTTGGDLIYGGASGSPTRLANGSAGQVLTSAGGTSAPTWSSPVGVFTVTAVSSNITLAAYNTYLVDTSSARSLQLPAPSAGLVFYIKDKTGQANTNNITLVRNASEQIEGVAASKVLQTNWGSWMIVSDGTNWFIL